MIHPQVFVALQEGIDVLTPRSRLARELGAAYEAEQSRSVFSSPRIFFILDWIKRQISPMLQQQGIMLCDPAATALLWEDALTQMPKAAKQAIGLDIFATDEGRVRQKFIHQAQQAWRLIHLYDISWQRRDYSNFALPRFFHQWASLYQQLCKEKKVMDEWQAAVEFNRAIYEKSTRPPQSLWVGWGECPPCMRKLGSS